MTNIKKNVLLLGSSGYLGSQLKNYFSSYNVFCTSASKKENTIHLNYLDKETYKNINQNSYEYILLLASTLKGLGTTEFKKEYLDVDTIGLTELLQFITENKLSKKLIYISSMTVYATDNKIPVKEEGNLQPLSTYGLSKLLGEKIFHFHCTNNSATGVILRIPGIYGGERTSGYIYNTVIKCIKNQSVEIDTSSLGYWETINIDDLCIWINEFIENYNWNSMVDIFNISYGIKTDIIECASIIKNILASSSEIIIKNAEGYVDFYLNNEKIKQFTGVQNIYLRSLENYIKKIKS